MVGVVFHRLKSWPKWGRIALIGGGVLVALAITLYLSRRVILAAIIDRAIEQSVGIDSQTEVHELHSGLALISVGIPDWNVQFEGIELKWVLQSLFRMEIDFQISHGGESAQLAGSTFTNYRVDLSGSTVRGTPTKLIGTFTVREWISSQLKYSRVKVELRADSDGSLILGEAIGEETGKTSFTLTGSPLERALEAGYSAEIRFENLEFLAKAQFVWGGSADLQEWAIELNEVELKALRKRARSFFGKRMEGALALQYHTGEYLLLGQLKPFENDWVQTRWPAKIKISTKPEKGETQSIEVHVALESKEEKIPAIFGRRNFKNISVDKISLDGQIGLSEGSISAEFGSSLGRITYLWGSKDTRQALTVAEARARGTLSPEGEVNFSAELRELSHVAESKALYPLHAELKMVGTYPELQITGALKDMIEIPLLSWRGKMHLKKGSGRVGFARKVTPESEDFDPETLTPLAEGFKLLEGAATLSGQLEWRDWTFTKNRAYFRAEDLSFEVKGIPVKGINGAVELTQFLPPRSRLEQVLLVKEIGTLMPLTQTRVSFSFDGKGNAKIEGFETRLGRGKIRLPGFDVSLDDMAFKTEVQVEDLELEPILEGAQVKRLQVKGVFEGSLPIEFRDDFLHIENGILRSKGEGGWVHYKDETLVGVAEKINYIDQFQELLSRGQQALAFKALDNFYYSKAELRLSRRPKTGLDGKLSMSGSNPDLANGQKFEFNIGLSGKLEEALQQSLLGAMMMPEALADKLKKLQE